MICFFQCVCVRLCAFGGVCVLVIGALQFVAVWYISVLHTFDFKVVNSALQEHVCVCVLELSVYVTVSVYVSVSVSVCLSVRPSVRPSIVCLSVCRLLSVCLCSQSSVCVCVCVCVSVACHYWSVSVSCIIVRLEKCCCNVHHGR